MAACVECCLHLIGTIARAEVTTTEGRAEFLFFRNAMGEIKTHSIYHVTERDILAGALKALQSELGPKLGALIPPGIERKTDEDLWLIYQDSLLKLAHSAEARQSLKSLVELSLRGYCRTLDRYSDYDDYETWEKSEEFGKADYVGVGITLLAEREDDIVCVPISGGAADRVGIEAGDRLLAVDEHPVRGASLTKINTWIAETQAGGVKLRVRRDNGAEETFTLSKEPIKTKSVSVDQDGDAWRITLHGEISGRCAAELRAELRSIGRGKKIILDLRGCPGGEVKYAAQVAEMFLPADTVIARLEKLTDTETLRSVNLTPYQPAQLTIRQDRFTASGAELVIAALLNYRPLRARSVGENTYGKGVTIMPIRVSAKNIPQSDIRPGVVSIAVSHIYGPSGETWDKKGLPPSTGGDTAP